MPQQLSLFDTTIERWASIQNTQYTISTDGIVKNPDGFTLKPKSSNAYPTITIGGKQYLLHRLVAEAFIPNPDNKPYVNHINGNITDYHVYNLEWVTHAENMHRTRRHYVKPSRKQQPVTGNTSNWKDIPNYDRPYKVSEDGNVLTEAYDVNVLCVKNGVTVQYVQHKPKALLVQHTNQQGYKFVRLQRNGKMKNIKVHRLVAEAFIPNPDNKPFVNHINGIKHDNLRKNLEWATAKENSEHAYLTGLTPKIGVVHRVHRFNPHQPKWTKRVQLIETMWADAITNPYTYTKASLSRKYKITDKFVRAVFNRHRWCSITNNLSDPLWARQTEKHICITKHTIQYRKSVVSLPHETWARIDGYKHRYWISDFGRCKSTRIYRPNKTTYVVDEILLVPLVDKLSRLCVKVILNSGKRVRIFIHQLVASAFVSNPDNLPYVKHIDKNRSNCYANNLRWTNKTNEPDLPLDIILKIGACQQNNFSIEETMNACNVTRRQYARYLKYFRQTHPELPKKYTRRRTKGGSK